jgi:outer membrane lipoprotein carrier protein
MWVAQQEPSPPPGSHKPYDAAGTAPVGLGLLSAVAAVLLLANLDAALGAPFPGQTEPVELPRLIDGLQAKYSRMKGLAAGFIQIYQGPDGRTRRESGRLLLKRPGKARWDYSNPEAKHFISDGKNVFFYVEGEREATWSTIKASADPQIPFLFLLGRGNLRREFSRIELLSEAPIVTGNRVLLLAPRRAPEEFKRLIVEVNPATFQATRLTIFERNGARMDFILTDVREGFIAADSEFKFTPPPGVTLRRVQ